MRIQFMGLLCLTALAVAHTTLATTVLNNATIYTSDEANPQAEAMAYADNGQILAVGTADEISQLFPDATQIDAGGATVVPGLIDAHGHVLGLGQALMRVDLRGTSSKDEVVKRMQDFAADLPPGQWLLGRGWDQNDWPEKSFPSASDLDQAFPERPVWVRRIDGHAAWGNSAALREVDKKLSGSWQPEGGEIIRDEADEATGVFIDRAMALVESQIPEPTLAQQREALRRATEKAVSVGLTSVHDAGTSLADWRLMTAAYQAGELKHRVYAMADGIGSMLDLLCEKGFQREHAPWLEARSVKLYADGALGSRGAAMLHDYADQPGQQGLLLQPIKALNGHVQRAVDCQLQVNVHAIGDRGNRVVLNAVEAAASDTNPGRHRVEHAQVIAVEDIPRFKKLGLIASMQPTHATSDMYWAEDRVGKVRIRGAYAWQRLTRFGVPLAFGSDFPVERAEPLEGFYAAITRQDAKGWPTEGWYPRERVSREQALHGFTMGAAYAAFQERQLGSLAAGKRADFVLLSDDIMTVAPEKILSTKVLATYIDGKPVFQLKQ